MTQKLISPGVRQVEFVVSHKGSKPKAFSFALHRFVGYIDNVVVEDTGTKMNHKSSAIFIAVKSLS